MEKKKPKQNEVKKTASKDKKSKPTKQSKPKVEAKTNKKKKYSTKSLVSLIVLFVMGISSGVFAGNWFVANFIGGPITDYSLFSEADLRRGNDIIATNYSTRVPTATDAWKSFVAAESNLSTAQSFDVMSNGLVDTIVKQTVYSRKIYNGEDFFFEQISDGLVAVADKYIYKPALYDAGDPTTHINHYKGSLKGKFSLDEHISCPFDCKHGDTTAFAYNTSYNESSPMTMTEYVDSMGFAPIGLVPYIVSQRTVLSQENFRVVEEDGKTKYCFSLNLHPGASVLNYVKQMKTVSGLSDYPSFTNVRLDVALIMLDGKVMLDSIDAVEKYSVKYGSLSPKCTGTLHQRFLYNGDYTIPA